jgi:thioredoxin 1
MKKIFIVLLFMAITVLNANASDFLTPKLEKAKKEKKFVMLELGSKGCIPCEKMRPVMDKLTKEYGRRIEVIFVDVRENPDIAKQWGVYVIPVQVFLNKDGVEVHRHIGYYPFEDIVKVLKKLGI